MAHKPKITVIVGPTAAGKTGTGIKAALNNNGVVISTDSRQIYAGLNIGTAKPEEAWQNEPHDIFVPDTIEKVPHYFLNTYSPVHQITLSRWQEDAYRVIDNLVYQDTPILLVGGTMLYVDSIVYNYLIPHVSPNKAFRDALEQESADTLYKQLKSQDPAATKFIESHNKGRIIRALEVINETGQPFSSQRQKGPQKYDFEILGIFPGWEKLTENITKRVHEMLREGLIQETKDLITKYSPDLPLLKTMNYAQVIKYLNKEYSQEEAIGEMIKVNIRYARRQMSWWKNRSDIKWTIK